MSLSASTNWEVRATGSSDTNGGGFFNRVSGTSVDYTRQASAQLTLGDLACANSTTLTSATGGFTAAMQGNLIQVASGTNFTPGFYEVVAFTNANTVTLDRNPTNGGAATGGTGSLGGALATLAKAFGGGVTGNTFWVQQGTYPLTTPPAPPVGTYGSPTSIIGYKAARGDGDAAPDFSNCPTLQATAGFPTAGATSGVLAVPVNFTSWRNMILDANSIARCGATTAGGAYTRFDDCKAINWKDRGFEFLQNARARRCTATLGVAGASASFYSNGNGSAGHSYVECVALSNPCAGFYLDGAGISLIDSFAIGSTGASGHGIFQTGATQGSLVRGSTAAGNAGSGFYYTGYLEHVSLTRNIFANNAGYGIQSGGANYLNAQVDADFNAFYNNAAGARSSFPAGAHDLVPAAAPFVNSVAGNYALNSNSPGGAQVRGLGSPALVFGLAATANAASPGASQPTPGATAAGGVSKSRLIGGM